jgi:hypothetical protein
VRYLEIQRDERLRADQRSDTEKYFGDPDYARSALAEYRQRQDNAHSPQLVVA